METPIIDVESGGGDGRRNDERRRREVDGKAEAFIVRWRAPYIFLKTFSFSSSSKMVEVAKKM